MNLLPTTDTKKCRKCKVHLPIARYTNRLDAYCTKCKDTDVKKCSMCREILPLDSFHKNARYCKTCNKKRLAGSKDKYNSLRKERRRKASANKPPRQKEAGALLSGTVEYKRLHRKKYKYNKKMAGKLTIKTIQLVYEDNIKKFGTLTCYLCLKPIEMVKEHLEHKTPLSRGGSNNYENLGISCSYCNRSKHDKTVVEYLEYLNKKRR